jgi:hypothetical protein
MRQNYKEFLEKTSRLKVKHASEIINMAIDCGYSVAEGIERIKDLDRIEIKACVDSLKELKKKENLKLIK